MIRIRWLYMLVMGQAQLLPFKIHSYFNSSNKITKKISIFIIYVNAPLKIFALPCTTPNHVQMCLFYRLWVPLPIISFFENTINVLVILKMHVVIANPKTLWMTKSLQWNIFIIKIIETKNVSIHPRIWYVLVDFFENIPCPFKINGSNTWRKKPIESQIRIFCPNFRCTNA